MCTAVRQWSLLILRNNWLCVTRAQGVLALCWCLCVQPARAQAGSKDSIPAQTCFAPAALNDEPVRESDYARMAELAGVAAVRSHAFTRAFASVIRVRCDRAIPPPLRRVLRGGVRAGSSGIEILPVNTIATYNSAYPRDRDNGLLWSGRGFSAGAFAGVGFRVKGLSGALAPAVSFQQNLSFEIPPQRLPGYPTYVNAHNGAIIDLPQRFGDDPYTTVDAGASFLRLEGAGLALGVSNENMQWGPAVRNPLLLSYHAGGFPHAYIETRSPVSIGIGRLDAQLFAGRLTESKYFDFSTQNNHRVIEGISFTFEPKGLSGLFLGAGEVFELTLFPPNSGLTRNDFIFGLIPLLNPDNTNRPGNILMELFGRWVFPESGFEVYAEWGRDDYFASIQDLIKEPDHSQVYTLGFQKVSAGPKRWVRLAGELTHLEGALPLRAGRGVVQFYTHGLVTQGHTQLGQPLGTAIPPGSDAQYLALDVFGERGSFGVFAERARYNDDDYYALPARYYGSNGHDVELTAGIRGSYLRRFFNVRAEVGLSHRYNRDFIGEDGVNRAQLIENNLGARITAGFWPRPKDPSMKLSRRSAR